MSLIKHQKGVTLLETLLVLAIAASLIVFGIRLYNQFKYQVLEQKIAANVNQLFLGLQNYYYANCRVTLDNDSTHLSSGALDPLVSDDPTIPLTISLSVGTDLVTPGFITGWYPVNTLVDNSATDNGYFTQYNRVLTASQDPVMSVYACTGSTYPPSCDATGGATLQTTSFQPVNQSRVIVWVSQVAVKLSPNLTTAQWTQIKNDLSANCVSSSTKLTDCTTTPTGTTGYLIWTKHPTAYNPNTASDYWTIAPYVKQFNMQYTNDGMAALSGVKDETKNPTTSKIWYDPLNYLCGG